ncbi:ABC transporter, ATP-binding protein [Verrucomicrobiia bacterium DG1235]|nr:ABC transporter, ATP-binding protein [Verrucomicrobiae bacterium DG1235]
MLETQSTEAQKAIAPQSDDVLIRAENVGKIFCRDLKRSLIYGAGDCFSDMFAIKNQRKLDSNGEPILRKHEFWANKGISFELRRGECLGLIGHNGAGKTTLLKMLNGLIKPDTGRIETRGRVGALIALGVGFNPVLTGRENIYSYGSLLGLTKSEIAEKYDEIVDFSEIPDSINAPVQSYSSGMRVRLGFAVASSLNPDILLLDEVLAVGDAAFRYKCLSRITSLMSNSAVIFVSHNQEQIRRICTSCLYLQKGSQLNSGDTSKILDQYFEDQDLNNGQTSHSVVAKDECITEFSLSAKPDVIETNDPVEIQLLVDSTEDIPNCFIRLIFLDANATAVAEYNSHNKQIRIDIKKGKNTISLPIESFQLKQGNYPARLHLCDVNSPKQYLWVNSATKIRVKGSKGSIASYLLS